MIEVAGLCLGVGFLLGYSRESIKAKAQILNEAIRVKELKGFGDLLGKKTSRRSFVVFGTVGSTAPVESNRSGAMGVFFEETAKICFRRENRHGSTQEFDKKIVLNDKEVPWYLDDGTARVHVMEARYAQGFYDTLKKSLFAEPVTKLVESFPYLRDAQILEHSCCEYVLEIGTPLTVIGMAKRDKDGAPTIGRAYEVFNGHLDVDEIVSNLESDSNCRFYGKLSLLLTAIGVAIVAVEVMHSLHIPLVITRTR